MGEGDIDMQDVTPSTSGAAIKPEKKRFEVKKVIRLWNHLLRNWNSSLAHWLSRYISFVFVGLKFHFSVSSSPLMTVKWLWKNQNALGFYVLVVCSLSSELFQILYLIAQARFGYVKVIHFEINIGTYTLHIYTRKRLCEGHVFLVRKIVTII